MSKIGYITLSRNTELFNKIGFQDYNYSEGDIIVEGIIQCDLIPIIFYHDLLEVLDEIQYNLNNNDPAPDLLFKVRYVEDSDSVNPTILLNNNEIADVVDKVYFIEDLSYLIRDMQSSIKIGYSIIPKPVFDRNPEDRIYLYIGSTRIFKNKDESINYLYNFTTNPNDEYDDCCIVKVEYCNYIIDVNDNIYSYGVRAISTESIISKEDIGKNIK